ncbi:glycosyltransferase [Brachybacterium sp. Marseille-Q7125]|uniref:glycosyltransferase n=1 Tax=Brachybacterium sp. Marseille-Q7125 TaxID=2932815 RepID=UPI001FF2818B|nr:glycosyltransferase [Brachybacterium sp. Marseille-Q7125]
MNRDVAASIIIPSYRGANRLPFLFDALAVQAPGTPPFEVILVIDGVDDGSVALAEAEDRFPLRHLLLPENQGRVTALNTGFETARGEVLIRCDDDLLVPPTFVTAHVTAHREAASPIGVIGVTWDVHEPGPYARAYGSDAARRSFEHARSRGAGERWRLWAANCSITRATWEHIGPYDPTYRAYGWEDVDYGWRLHEAGIPLVTADGAIAAHHGPARTASARAGKAFEAGAARATFSRLHPEAPLPTSSPGKGAWGRIVGAVARRLRHSTDVERAGAVVDCLVPLVPAPVGRKLVAAVVEGAGHAGATTAGATTASTSAAPTPARPRIAIAHDYLTQRGGAERVVLSLVKAFPDAQLHTLFYEPEQTYPEFRDVRIRTSVLNRIGPLRRDPRLALPLLAPIASRMRIDADVVIASSSGWAHAFPTAGRKLVYCHSPARWLYLPGDYLGDAGPLDPKRLALRVLSPFLRRWDRRAASAADQHWGNSSVVVERIRDVYGIEAEPLFPPFSPDVAEGEQEPIPELAGWAGPDGTEGGHYLVVSRLQPYKNVDQVIAAFDQLPAERLLVIGRGPEKERLLAGAGANVRLVEGLSDAQMRWAYAHARALIAASHEDFGLTPLEAGAHGVPTIALRAGGYLDTVTEGVNGLFFEEGTSEAIREAVSHFDPDAYDAESIRQRMDSRFGEERFITALRLAAQEALS